MKDLRKISSIGFMGVGLLAFSLAAAPVAEKDAESSAAEELSLGLANDLPELPAPSRKAASEDSVGPNLVTNLEFKHDSKSSRIIVHAPRKISYTETRSEGARQYVYLLENTTTPEKYQRAYDTTEFASPVALFTLFQLPGSKKPTSKLIVQLREEQTPLVTDSDRGLILEFSPLKSAEPHIAAAPKKDLLGGENIYARGGVYSGDVIQRLEIKNSDVQDVLRLIARSSGYNIVIGEDVTGKIGTLSLTGIPWDQAFTLVLQSKKLGFVREGNVLRVGTTAALRAEKEEFAAVEKAAVAVEPLKTILLPVSYAKVADLVPRGKPFLTDRGSIDADVRTNTIIIKDVESVVTRVQKLLLSLDTQPPRVSISAKIVEINSSLTRNIGMGSLSGRVNFNGTNSGGFDFSPTSAPGAFTASISAPDFLNLSSSFRIGEIDNKVRTLANPSVTVVANQTGTVTQSLSFFIPFNSVVGGVFTPGYTQVTTTLNMAVTPIVSGDGSIFMTLNINNDIPQGSGALTTIASRAVNTQVLVENGDTAVIGGVFQNTVTNEKEGLPLIMRIPLLGYLFSTNTTVDKSSEIFIFLTAKILNAEESLKRSL